MKPMRTAALIAAAGLAVTVGAACAATSNAAPAASATNGSTHIQAWSVNSDGPYFQSIATGAIGDYGPGLTVLPDGTPDPEHTHQLEFKFRHGTFRIEFASADKAIVTAYSHWQVDQKTCSGDISVSAREPVVPGSGTGAYQGITGSFDLKVTIDEEDEKPVCNGTSPFLSQLILLTATGTVSY